MIQLPAVDLCLISYCPYTQMARRHWEPISNREVMHALLMCAMSKPAVITSVSMACRCRLGLQLAWPVQRGGFVRGNR